jgi:hypothetical protein
MSFLKHLEIVENITNENMNFNFQNKIILATLLVAFSFLLRKRRRRQ